MPSPSRDIGRVDQRRTRLLAGVFTAVLHLLVVGVAIWLGVRPQPRDVERTPDLIMASVAQQQEQPEPLSPPDVTLLEPAAPPTQILPRVTFSTAPPAAQAPSSTASTFLTDAQLAGAVQAGQGSGGGGCDMAAAVQQVLRRDSLARRAVDDARLQGRAILLWDGDWVRAGGQAGKGLSAVREAVLWEVGFAPQACRNAQMHGLVLLSLNDGTRFAIGAANWRWSDLLGVNPGMR